MIADDKMTVIINTKKMQKKKQSCQFIGIGLMAKVW
jgi:hypothetical protein